MEDWKHLIYKSTDVSWKAKKLIDNLVAHKRKYPEFIVERIAEYFSEQSPKYQGALAYADIAKLNQELRKHKYRTKAEQECDKMMNNWENSFNPLVPSYDKDKDPYGY
jgi:hypothetical protein